MNILKRNVTEFLRYNRESEKKKNTNLLQQQQQQQL